MLWNQTSGIQARPVFWTLIRRYPHPEQLAAAKESDLVALLRPIGLQNIRAKRCISLGKMWEQHPPTADKQYRRRGYPSSSGTDAEGFEVAHLPGVGPYALDSFRIFYRDTMRGLPAASPEAQEVADFEPEWKRVLPLDKELRAYLRWKWLKEGIEWDDRTGQRTLLADTRSPS